jgi:hypothetical protein
MKITSLFEVPNISQILYPLVNMVASFVNSGKQKKEMHFISQIDVAYETSDSSLTDDRKLNSHMGR